MNTDELRSETGIATMAPTRFVLDGHLCSSVFICGFTAFHAFVSSPGMMDGSGSEAAPELVPVARATLAPKV